jgi:putative hemolysin
MPADEMADLLGITLLTNRDHETVAGLVINELHHLPETGEAVEAVGWRFEVVDMSAGRLTR